MTPSVKVLFLSAAFLSAAHVAAAHPRHSDASPGLAHAAPASSCAGQGGWGAIIQADRPSACPDEPMPEQLLARKRSGGSSRRSGSSSYTAPSSGKSSRAAPAGCLDSNPVGLDEAGKEFVPPKGCPTRR